MATQTELVKESRSVSTDLILGNSKYDEILSNNKKLDSVVNELLFRKELLLKAELVDKIVFNPMKSAECSNTIMSLIEAVVKPSFEQLLKACPQMDLMNPLISLKLPEQPSLSPVKPQIMERSVDVHPQHHGEENEHKFHSGKKQKKNRRNLPSLNVLPVHESSIQDIISEDQMSASEGEQTVSHHEKGDHDARPLSQSRFAARVKQAEKVRQSRASVTVRNRDSISRLGVHEGMSNRSKTSKKVTEKPKIIIRPRARLGRSMTMELAPPIESSAHTDKINIPQIEENSIAEPNYDNSANMRPSTSTVAVKPVDLNIEEKAKVIYNLQVNEVYRKLVADNFKVYDVLALILYALAFELTKQTIYEKALADLRTLLEANESEKQNLQEIIRQTKRQVRELTGTLDNETDLSHESPDKQETVLGSRESPRRSIIQLNLEEEITKFEPGGSPIQQSRPRQLISLVSTGSFSQFKNPMPLKSVLKSISTIYSERAKDLAKPAEGRKQSFEDYVYEYFIQYFGIKDIADKKFCAFVLSLKYHAVYFRVNIFSRFMGLVPGYRYSQEQVSKFVEGLQYLEKSKRGYSTKITDTSARLVYPYIRAEDYLKEVFTSKSLALEELFELKKKIEECKEEDPSGRNTWVIDADVFLEIVIGKYGSLVNRNQQHLIEVFDACDLDGSKTCSVNEWVLLFRHIEPTSFELAAVIKIFFDNADVFSQGEHCMSFDKFAAVCHDRDLFTENSQNSFLTRGYDSVQDACESVRQSWAKRMSELGEKITGLSNLTEDETSRWRFILKVLDRHFLERSCLSAKSVALAYSLAKAEIDRMSLDEKNFD